MPQAAGLWYERHGAAEAPPLILSPGLGGIGYYWLPNVAALAEHFSVILYDHRGTGQSDRALPPTVTVDDLADDILALMDALGIGRASIVGHAAGAVAGLALALKAPERLDRLVSVNGWPALDAHFALCFDVRLRILRDSGPQAYLEAQPLFLYPATWISRNAARLAAGERLMLNHFAGVETFEKRIAALRGFDIDARLGDIPAPVLALASKDDMLVPWTCSQRLADGLPRGAMTLMDWGGHACNVTDPDRFNTLVLDFLRS